MGFRDTSILCKIVLILLSLCFCFDLIGFAIPYWSSVDAYVMKTNVGLWDQCIETSGAKECAKISESTVEDWFRAVRAFSTLSWVFFLVALVLVIIFVFFKSDKKELYVAAICLSFVGAFCAMIAFAVFAGEMKLEEYNAGFAFTIVAFILELIAGVLGILDCLEVVGGK
ncbi:hypothetical protein CHS0354_014098 [Potamilus streckersoni]|uniref:Uncharacterized protein n=1 Tax=Potamilus streckersoni TaxID=2493646 RepID=A0AAE0TJQ7_9BIVA|nr:hypothetical protein CHS0354_014098 [Potamilus streckersoni]